MYRVQSLTGFAFYLSERFQSVIVDGVVSASRPLVYGVPQGSVLRPVLFTLYSQPLSDVISDHDCDHHKYADDNELSKGASPDQLDSVQSCIQTDIGDVLIWMNSNNLKLNTTKTEVMPVGSASRVALVESECANIGGNSVPFCLLNTSESISIGHCLCGSTSTVFVGHPSWSFNELHQTIFLPKCHCKTCRDNDHFSS